MKYLLIILLFICIQSQAQITGNADVKDPSAIPLNSEAVEMIAGKWKLIKTVEYLQDEEQVREKGFIVDFDKEGAIKTSWCIGCHQENTGQWQIISEQTIKFVGNFTGKNKHLAGDWVAYKLNDREMILAKVLTSSGDWKKFQYYSREIGNPPVNDATRYCINCTSSETSCFGDRPEEAMQQWARLYSLLSIDEAQLQHSVEVLEKYDWLLKNAPCINKALYVNAVEYYEGLMKGEKDEQVKKGYQDKIKQIKEQQQVYYKN